VHRHLYERQNQHLCPIFVQNAPIKKNLGVIKNIVGEKVMKRFWKVLSNWKRVVKLIDLIKQAYADKKITGTEAEAVLREAIDTLVEMGVMEK